MPGLPKLYMYHITVRVDLRHNRVKYYRPKYGSRNKWYIGSSTIGPNGEFIKDVELLKFCKLEGI